MRQLFLFLLFFFTLRVFSQPSNYTTANAHSHNDYEKPVPFREAYDQQFGSIEADIFLQDGKLIVAHQEDQLAAGRTLESLYLDPLAKCIEKNNGTVYRDKTRQL